MAKAMATAGSITISLLAATSSFETDMQRAAKTADREAKRIADSARKNAQDTERAWSMASTAIGASLGAISVGAIFARLTQNTINAANEQAQLAAVLRSTGEAAGWSADQLNEMAANMSRASTVSAGEINNAQTTLLAFTNIAGAQFPKALQAAIDMAARTGMSVVSAAETIGRALDIPSQGLTALSRQGFRFTDDQKKLAEQLEATGRTAEAQGIVLGSLTEIYGGAAEAARGTLAGSLAVLTNSFDDLLTGSDQAFSPIVDGIEAINNLLSSGHAEAALRAISVAALGVATVFTGRLIGSVAGSAVAFTAATAEAARYQAALARMAGVAPAAAAAIGGVSAAARAGSVALGVLGGPAGLAVTLGLTAAAFFAMGGSAGSAAGDLDELTASVEGLTAAQIKNRLHQANDAVEARREAFENESRALDALRRDYDDLAKHSGVTAQELQNLSRTIDEQQALVDTASQNLDKATEAQRRLGESAAMAAGGVQTLSGALAGTNEAGQKYLERLSSEALIVGLKTRRQQLDAMVEAKEVLFTPEDLQKAQAYADKIDQVNKSLSGGGRSKSAGTDPLAAYRARLVESQALTAELQKYGLAVDDMLPSEKELLKLQGQMTLAVKDRVGKTSDATLKAQIALTQETAAQEKLAKQLRQTLQFRQQYTDSILDENAGLYESILQLQDQTAAFALTEDESARNAERLLQSRLALRIAKEEEILATQRLNGASQEEIATTEQVLAGLRTQLEYRQKMAELGDTVRQQMEERRAFERTVSSWTDTVREIDDVFREGFAAMINDGEGSWKAFTRSMVTTFKTTVADALYKAFAQPFVVRVVAQMAGLISGPGVASEVLKQAGVGGSGIQLTDLFRGASLGGGNVSDTVASSLGNLGMRMSVMDGTMGKLGASLAQNSAAIGKFANSASQVFGYGKAIYDVTQGSYGSAIGTAVGTYILPGIGTAIGSALGGMVDGMFSQPEARYGGTYTFRPGEGTMRPGWAAGDAGPAAMQFADTLLTQASDAVQHAFSAAGSDVVLRAFEASFESSEKGRGGTHSGGTLVIDGHEISFGTSKKGQGYGGRNGTLEEMMQAAEVDTWQTVIQAWQAAIDVFPSMMQDMIRGVDADALGLDAAQAVAQQFVAVIEQVNALSAGLKSLPFVPAVAGTFDFAAALAQAAGGAENAANLLNGFYQNYYSETERAAHLTAQLTERFAELGYTLPQTREEFRGLVEANMALGEGGARTTAELLAMESALSSLLPAFEAITETIVDVAAEANAAFDAQLAKVKSLADESGRLLGLRNSAGNLLDQIDRAMGRTGKFGLQREAELWAAMATASYEQQIDLASELTSITLDRYQEEIAAAERLADLGASLRNYVQGLKISDMSPLTLGQRLAEAGSQYAEMLSRAQAGDTDAMAGLQGMADSYLRLARDYYASSDQYTQIFNSVTGGLDELGVQAQSDAERQIAVGVDSLAQLESLHGVAQSAYAALDRQYQHSVEALARETSLLVDLGQDTGRLHDIASLLGSLPADLAARLQPFLDTAARGTVTDWYQDAGRGQGDAGGVDYWQGELGKRPESQVKDSFLWGLIADWYKTDLGRNAAENEIAYWFEQAKKNGTQSAYQDFLWGAQSELHGSHASGLAYVPFDGYRAELHQGERVLTAAESRAYQAMPNWQNYGRGNEALIAEIRRLNDRIGQLETAVVKATADGARAISETTARSATHIADRADEAASRASYEASIR